MEQRFHAVVITDDKNIWRSWHEQDFKGYVSDKAALSAAKHYAEVEMELWMEEERSRYTIIILPVEMLINTEAMIDIILKTEFVQIKKHDNPLEIAVDEVYPKFSGMDKYFSRLDRATFGAFCHSMASNGIAMQIRNKYHFAAMAAGQPPSDLYKYLKYVLHISNYEAMAKPIIDSCYDRYHKENPEAYKEREKYLTYIESPDYKKPSLPFDITMPGD